MFHNSLISKTCALCTHVSANLTYGAIFKNCNKRGIAEHNGYGFETKEAAAEAMVTSFKSEIIATYLGKV